MPKARACMNGMFQNLHLGFTSCCDAVIIYESVQNGSIRTPPDPSGTPSDLSAFRDFHTVEGLLAKLNLYFSLK